jgi:hypothetical protein
MNIDIRHKIYEVLKQDSYSERDVVYVLVELYKFLEKKYGKQFGKGKYDVVKFYRDWSCHSFLHGASYKVFVGIDALIKEEAKKPNAVGHLDWQDQMAKKIRDCFRGYGPLSLKEELLKSFAEIGYEGPFSWTSFRASLYQVLRDTSLIIKDGDDVIFEFRLMEPYARKGDDDLTLNVIIKSEIYHFALDDRSL